MGEEVLNTASSFGGFPLITAPLSSTAESENDVSSMPSGSGDSELFPNEVVMTTASTFMDSVDAEFDVDVAPEVPLQIFGRAPQRVAAVKKDQAMTNIAQSVLEVGEPKRVHVDASARFPESASSDKNAVNKAQTAEARLRRLRMNGSAIQQRIGQALGPVGDSRPAQQKFAHSVINESRAGAASSSSQKTGQFANLGEAKPSPGQQSSDQFLVAVQTPDGIMPGVVTLLRNSQ